MSKLYVIGDSYAADRESHIDDMYAPYESQWSVLLSKKLKATLINYGSGGASVEHAINRFYEKILPEIKREDTLVFCKTFYLRKFLDKNRPSFSMLPVLDSHYAAGILSKQDYNFYTRLFLDVVRSDVESYHAFNFINTLAYYRFKIGFKVVVLNCFPPTKEEMIFQMPKTIVSSTGCLSHITRYEFKDSEISDKKIPANMMDPRRNHMDKKNHKILVNKIFHSIINNEVVDLNNGFKKNLYSVDELCVNAHNRTEWDKKYSK